MLMDEICKLRDKLNKSILTNDIEDTYELSIELDELIAQYYRQQKGESESTKEAVLEIDE